MIRRSGTAPRTLFVVSCALAATLSLGACGHKGGRPVNADLAASKVTTIGVNAYLWRASLDTLSFMPLLQTDSNGGVIVTDWYINPAAPSDSDAASAQESTTRVRGAVPGRRIIGGS